jgi:hypothetical protein
MPLKGIELTKGRAFQVMGVCMQRPWGQKELGISKKL